MVQDHKLVYAFRSGNADGGKDMKVLLGGKGANLAEMASIGLPVPPGFTVTTAVCTDYVRNGCFPPDLKKQVEAALRVVEGVVGNRFNDNDNPLLLSVRSGARVSMPGMMDTILNLGLNDATVEGLANASKDPRFAYDCYRRFIAMYSNVVLKVNMAEFENALEQAKNKHHVKHDHELTAEQLKKLVNQYKEIVPLRTGNPFPTDPYDQLWGAISAVFSSWQNDRAITYRNINNIPHNWGTAVNVQAMVFGNRGNDCATGVAFTRNPSTGEKQYFGEYLVNAQGEDVVSGVRTPQSINKVGNEGTDADAQDTSPTMEEEMPEMYAELVSVFETLERHYRDVQDIEFTVQNKKLYILQTRSAKRTTQAAVRTAVDMAHEELITKREAVMRVDPDSLNKLFHPTIDRSANNKILTAGHPASPGAAFGAVVFTAEDAVAQVENGKDVILVRKETSADDIQGMHKARGILTAKGGMTSHAAVVARNMGRPCVTGANELNIDFRKKQMTIHGVTVKEGDLITIDGFLGNVMLGKVRMEMPKKSAHYETLMGWADDVRRMRVLANADTPQDALNARENGAQGVGLVRTEHMFFDPDRITVMHRMILAENEKGRRAALDELLPMQREDFRSIFDVMKGYPVTIRLLDPPLHEFLPRTEKEMSDVSRATGINVEHVRDIVHRHHEANPMLGHRGCRLLISHPEICEMQARAIFEASVATGFVPHVMVPLVSTIAEFDEVRKIIEDTANTVSKEMQKLVRYSIGTMIELPRAALRAHELAQSAEFFSFGTNDLTQTTYGLSRDDAAAFIHTYTDKGIMPTDPFITLDDSGVGELIAIACERGRSTNRQIELGICGEHGGDPASIDLCERIGLDYVSCSPFRVPVARLASAQARIKRLRK